MSAMSWEEAGKQADELIPGRYSMEWKIDGLPTRTSEVIVQRGEDGVMRWSWRRDERDKDRTWFDVSCALQSGSKFHSLVDDVASLFTYRWSLAGTADSSERTAEELLATCIKRMGSPQLVFIHAIDKQFGERRVAFYFYVTEFQPTTFFEDCDLSRQLCEEFNRMLSNAIFERDSSVGGDVSSVAAGRAVAASDQS
jgi:hypothetical protein